MQISLYSLARNAKKMVFHSFILITYIKICICYHTFIRSKSEHKCNIQQTIIFSRNTILKFTGKTYCLSQRERNLYVIKVRYDIEIVFVYSHKQIGGVYCMVWLYRKNREQCLCLRFSFKLDSCMFSVS